MPRGIPFTGEYLSRYLAAQKRWSEARDWRAKETEAGRPSTHSDFFRAHGLCPACAAAGIRLNENGVGFRTIGWNGNLPLYEECEACGGTGKIVTPS
jgi:hypothetical protein